jgi:hypothetical protein
VSLYATLYTHYNAFNFLSISKKKQMNQKKQKRNVYLKLEFCCIQSSMCKKQDQLDFWKKKKRDSQKFQLVFCMCVCASLDTKKLLKERERKVLTRFLTVLCVCMCVCVCVCRSEPLNEREREKEKTKDQLDFRKRKREKKSFNLIFDTLWL